MVLLKDDLFEKVSDNMKLKRLFLKTTINSKVQVGFGLFLVMMLLVSLFVWVNTNLITQNIKELHQKRIPALEINTNILNAINSNRVNIYRWEAGSGSLSVTGNIVEDNIHQLKKYTKDKDILKNLNNLYQLNNELREDIEELRAVNDGSIARKISIRELNNLYNEIDISTATISKLIWNRLKTDTEDIVITADNIKRTVLVLILVTLFIGIIMGLVVQRGINIITTKIKKKTLEAAQNSELLNTSNQTMKMIADSVENKITNNFKVISNLVNENQEVITTIEDVSISINDVAIEVDDLANQAEEISLAGNKTYQVIKKAKDRIDFGSKLIYNTVDIMTNLQNSVSKISNISNKIMKIADQTNLLALNASIEAARAGKFGQGFAVVADEIKILADESMLATKEIKEITNEVKEVTQKATKIMIADSGSEESIINIFTEINDLSNQINSRMKNVIEISDDQVASTEELSALSQEIAGFSEEASAQNKEAFNEIENLEDMMKDVTESNDELYSKIEEQIRKADEQLYLINMVVEENQKLK